MVPPKLGLGYGMSLFWASNHELPALGCSNALMQVPFLRELD